MKFSLAVVASCIAMVSAATVATTTASTIKLIMDDLSKIGVQFTKVDAAVNGFPQTGAKGANDIHIHEATIHTLFEDINNNLAIIPKPVSAENAKKIISTYQSFIPSILESLSGITAKASDFKSLGSAAATMSTDLSLSAAACKAFATGVLSITPAVMTDAVNTMFDQVDTARENASAALAE